MDHRFGRFSGYADCSGVPYPYWPAFSSSPSAQPSTSAAMYPPSHPLEFHHPTEGMADPRNSWAYYQQSSPDWSLTDDYYASMNSSSHNTHPYQSGIYPHKGEDSSKDVSSHGGFNSFRAPSSDFVSHPHWSTCDWKLATSGPTSSSEEVKSHEPLSKPLEPPSNVHVSSNGFEDTWGKLLSPNYGKPETETRNVDLNLDPSKCVTNGNGNHTGIQKSDGKSLLSNKYVADYTPENLLEVVHSSLNDSSKDVLLGDRSFIIRPKKLNFEIDLNRVESGSAPANNENDVSKEQQAATLLTDICLKGKKSDVVNNSSHKISAVVDGIHHLSEVLVHECFNNGNFLKPEHFENLEKVVDIISKCLRKINLNKTKEVETINVKPLPEDWSTLEEVKHKNEMTQSIKNVLVSNFPDEKEVEENSRTQMFKHLWLEAEAALCSATLIGRYHLVKNEQDDHILLDKEISGEAKKGEQNVEATSERQESPRSTRSNLDSVIFTAGLQTDSDTESETYSESDEDSIIDECNEETEDKVSTETSTDLDSPDSWEHV